VGTGFSGDGIPIQILAAGGISIICVMLSLHSLRQPASYIPRGHGERAMAPSHYQHLIRRLFRPLE
jgi:hypothetical protein